MKTLLLSLAFASGLMAATCDGTIQVEEGVALTCHKAGAGVTIYFQTVVPPYNLVEFLDGDKAVTFLVTYMRGKRVFHLEYRETQPSFPDWTEAYVTLPADAVIESVEVIG